MFLQCLEGHYLERALVGGRQHHGRGAPVVVSPEPVQRGDTPTIARQEAREAVLGDRRQQVIANGTLVFQKFSGHYRTDGVPAEVFLSGRTAAVPVKTGQWFGAARFQRTAQHVAIRHPFSIALLGAKFE